MELVARASKTPKESEGVSDGVEGSTYWSGHLTKEGMTCQESLERSGTGGRDPTVKGGRRHGLVSDKDLISPLHRAWYRDCALVMEECKASLGRELELSP